MKDALKQKGHSAVEELARFQLMKEKLLASHANTTVAGKGGQLVKNVLGKLTDVEKIRIRILSDISNYSESSPEYAQLRSVTGGKESYFEIADALATLVHQKMQAEQVLKTYTPNKKDLEAGFQLSASKAAGRRINKLSDNNIVSQFTDGPEKAVASKVVNAAFGAPPAEEDLFDD